MQNHPSSRWHCEASSFFFPSERVWLCTFFIMNVYIYKVYNQTFQVIHAIWVSLQTVTVILKNIPFFFRCLFKFWKFKLSIRNIMYLIQYRVHIYKSRYISSLGIPGKSNAYTFKYFYLHWKHIWITKHMLALYISKWIWSIYRIEQSTNSVFIYLILPCN